MYVSLVVMEAMTAYLKFAVEKAEDSQVFIELSISHEMPCAIHQAHLVRRTFVQHGHARIVEALWNNDAFGQGHVARRGHGRRNHA
jgi:hypothetical protein